MALGRSSYRGLSRLPAWGLYSPSGDLLATVRAVNAWEARDLFRRHAHKLFPDSGRPANAKVRKVP